MVDNGFRGMMVCGDRWLNDYRRRVRRQLKDGCRLEVEELPCSRNLYRFGGGSAVAIRTVALTVMYGGRGKCEKLVCDVVKGRLPCLLGLLWMKPRRVKIDVESDQVLLRLDGEDRFRAEELEYGNLLAILPWNMRCQEGLDLCGEVVDGYVSELTAAQSADGKDGETTKGVSGTETVGRAETFAMDDSEDESVRDDLSVDYCPVAIPEVSAALEKGKTVLEKDAAVKGPVAAVVKGKVPHVLHLKYEEVKQIHARTHLPKQRMLNFLVCAIPKAQRVQFASEIARLKGFVEQAVQECKQCALHVKRIRPRTKPTSFGWFNRLVFVDCVCLDKVRNIWALGVVEDDGDEFVLEPLRNRTAAEAADMFFLSWIAKWGCVDELCISDVGGEFLGEEFRDICMAKGFAKRCSPPYQHESNAKIERKFGVVRWSVDRFLNKRSEKKTFREWQVICKTIENEMRNTLLVGGYSASERSTGRKSSMHMHALNDTPASGALYVGSHVRALQQLEDDAREAVKSVLCDRKVRQMLSEKVLPVVRRYRRGEIVYYQRPNEVTGLGRVGPDSWVGPGVVTGHNPLDGYYQLDVSGVLVRASKYMMRGVKESRLGENNPVFAARDQVQDPLREELVERDDAPAGQAIAGVVRAEDAPVVQEAVPDAVVIGPAVPIVAVPSAAVEVAAVPEAVVAEAVVETEAAVPGVEVQGAAVEVEADMGHAEMDEGFEPETPKGEA